MAKGECAGQSGSTSAIGHHNVGGDGSDKGLGLSGARFWILVLVIVFDVHMI
jgi:hypothetical protein